MTQPRARACYPQFDGGFRLSFVCYYNIWTCCCSVRLGCGVVCGGDCAVAGGEADDTGSLITMLPCRFTARCVYRF